MKFRAKIVYKVDGNHPDIQDLPEEKWYDKVFTYEDEYYFEPETYDERDIDGLILYMKRDLKTVAGGGYNWEHIYDVQFEIERIDQILKHC